MSPLSRNHSFGAKLGRGLTMEQATAEMKQTTEGVKSCESILGLAQHHDVDMPIVEQVVAVVRDGQPAREVGPKLKARLERAGNGGMVQDVRTDADGWTARTIDGALAAHFEHSVAITADGPLVLGR